MVKTSLSSSLFRESAYAILGLGLASWWEFFIDHFNLAFTLSKKHYQDDKKAGIQVLVPYEKFVFLCGVTVVPMIALIPTDHPRLVMIYGCAINTQVVLFTGFICSLCSRCYSNHFSKTATTAALLAFIIVTTATAYLINHDPTMGFTDREMNILFAQWTITGLFLLAVARWFYCEFLVNLFIPRVCYYYAALKARRNGTKEKDVDWKEIHKENIAYYPIMYALMALLCLGFLGGFYSGTPIVYLMSDRDLFLLNMPVLAYQVCMTVLSSQVNKHAIVSYLHALLESKKSYVR